MATLTLKRGNPYTGTLTFADESGNVYDLTGKTVFFTVKRATDYSTNDNVAVITKNITTHTNASGGITVLDLTASQTDIAPGDYVWDTRVYDDSPLVQLNSDSGVCVIEDVVTKRIS